MEAGSVIGGKYRLRREIGQGSMGTVWAAVHELLDRQVAIKFLTQSFEDPSTAAARFMAEAKAAAQVKHRAVVDVFDFGITDQGVSYMVQELLGGQPLSQVMCDGPAWSIRDAARFMMECLLGLAAVHERGIVHRDLKPENIFVLHDSEGRVPKLLDFGISKSAEPRQPDRRVRRPSLRRQGVSRLTAIGAALGTPAYMSPEQLRNLSTLDARADVYSVGCVFYEWLAGHCPFASTHNFAELLGHIEARDMEPLDQVRPDVGPELCAVIARALEPDRDLRYTSAVEMRAAIARVFERLPPVRTKVQNQTAIPIAKTLPPPAFAYLPATHSIEVHTESLRPGSKPPSFRPPGIRAPSEPPAFLRPPSVRPEMLRAPSVPAELRGERVRAAKPESVRPKLYIPEADGLAVLRPSASPVVARAAEDAPGPARNELVVARSVTEALDSLKPPAPEKKHSRGFWLAALAVGLLLAAAPVVWRAHSRERRASAASIPVVTTATRAAAPPAAADGALPTGVLPPEAVPSHETMAVEPAPLLLPPTVQAPAEPSGQRAHKSRAAARATRSEAEPHRRDVGASEHKSAAPREPAPEPKTDGKLLRSLDF